ncbi:MAG TPA: ABC transporter ATP-binding protein [Candidatus Dormibacteraeota bacterium]|nr:ABC transporter ATP-binding protein [Candidatus Dormibacteraeota bacterium]
MRAISITGLHKGFRDTPVLRGLDLAIEAGSLTAILGPSGSGKTTLLRLIAGLERSDGGCLSLADEVVDDGRRFVRPERRRVGYVPQEASLFPHLTVDQNVGFGLSRRSRPGGRVPELLGVVGLGGLGSRYPHELSGGQQQRVALARALAIDPHLLLLDEPFSALDPGLRASVREEVREILAKTGITTLLVTHDQEEALSVADQVAVLRDGVVAQVGSPSDLYTDPIDLDMARFLGDANLIDGSVEAGRLVTPLGTLSMRPDDAQRQALLGPAVVLIRPEQIVITSEPEGGAPGRVLHSEFHGHDSVIEVASETPLLAGVIRVRVQGAANVKPNARVNLVASGEARAWPRPTG